MKLIIDISEDVYTRLFDNGIQDNEIAVDDVCEMARALRLGTPLDDVKAEIADLPTYMFEVYKLKSRVLYMLDNIGKAEMEEEE